MSWGGTRAKWGIHLTWVRATRVERKTHLSWVGAIRIERLIHLSWVAENRAKQHSHLTQVLSQIFTILQRNHIDIVFAASQVIN